jgi:hypothetical protein
MMVAGGIHRAELRPMGRPKSDLNDVVAVLASLGTQPQFPMFPLSLCDSIENSNATGQSDVERIPRPTGAPFFALPPALLAISLLLRTV